MVLNVNIKIQLDAFGEYDRIRIKDEIVKSIKKMLERCEDRNVKPVSIGVEIEKE